MKNKILFFLGKISIFDNFFYPRVIKKININKIKFLDIGAAGDLIPRWKKIKNILFLVCFEPNRNAYKELAKKINGKEGIVFNKALSNSASTKIIYNCLDSEKSSLYKPNIEFLKKFHNPERFSIQDKFKIKTDILDNFKNINIDFAKLDTQGSELDIIQGGSKTLKNCIGIEVEVEFHKIYKNQPLFGDVHKVLEKAGFEFVDFTEKFYWSYYNSKSNGSKLIYANALYLKKEEFLKLMNKEKILKYISICLLYNKMSYIDNAIKYLDFSSAKNIKQSLLFFYLRGKLIYFFKNIFNFFIKLLGSDLTNNSIN